MAKVLTALSMATLFLVRPEPLPGESLSSWRQRSGWANGYRLFPMNDERRRRTDHDWTASDAEAAWLASCHGKEVPEIHSLSSAALHGSLLKAASGRTHQQWWLECRVSGPRQSPGAMFCPRCLAEDAIPYYRLRWRLGFMTICPAHRCFLADRCGKCGASAWPAGAVTRDGVSNAFTTFRRCWRCADDLSKQPANIPAKIWPTDQVLRWLEDGGAEIGDAVIPAFDAFRGLRALCQLLLRRRTRTLLASGTMTHANFARSLETTCSGARSIEQLPVQARHFLLGAVWPLLENWPEGLIDFANSVGLKRWHFSGAYELQPPWLSLAIDTYLAHQNRWVSQKDLVAAVIQLRSELKRPPTKVEVRRRLHWQGDFELSEVLLLADW